GLAREGVLHRGQAHGMRAVGVRRGVDHRHLAYVELLARVPVGRGGQEGERLVVHPGLKRAEPTLAVGERAAENGLELPGVERLQDDHAAAREQRRVDLERRVLGGGPDQGHVAGLDMAEERVLLRLVIAMDLVYEEYCSAALTC